MNKRNHLMNLELTSSKGEILGTWTIGEKPEFDIEDLSASPEYDFYVKDYTDSENFAFEIWESEILRLYEIGYFK